MAPGGALDGKLSSTESLGISNPIGIVLLASPNRRLPNPRVRGSFAVAKDGAFRIENIPPGPWRIHLVEHYDDESGQEFIVYQPRLAAVQITSGERLRVEVDALRTRPGGLRGQILIDGAPLCGANFGTARAFFDDSTNENTQGGYADAEGRFEIDKLPAGHWRLSVTSNADSTAGAMLLEAQGQVEVEPDRTTEVVYRLATSRIQVTLVNSDGVEVANRELHLVLDSGRSILKFRTDEDGVGEFTVLRGARYHLAMRPASSSNQRRPVSGERWRASWIRLKRGLGSAAEVKIRIEVPRPRQ